MYSEVSDEIADWRQRYDHEFARAEENQKALEEVRYPSVIIFLEIV
jgi:hypothetical protein